MMSADRAGERNGGGRGVAWAPIAILVLALAFAPPAFPQTVGTAEETGMELSNAGPQLRSLHQTWQSWIQAYHRSDRQAASDATEHLLNIARFLGFSALPDLSLAAAACAVRSAREGDFERADWALEDARTLDAGRPEIAFAAANLRRLDGDWVGAAVHATRGYVQLVRLPLERDVWLHSAALRFLLVVLVSGCVLVAFQVAVQGPALYQDLLQIAPRSLPPPPLWLPAICVLLLWPLLLPAGVLWLALYWSVLIWGYVSLSERGVLVLLWLLLGVTPLALSYQQSRLQLSFIPPARALDNLAGDRLYGSFFTDLGVLRAMTPANPAVLELIADLHRHFDQWDQARPIYSRLVNDPEGALSSTAAPLNNLGLYYFRNKDYGAAVDYFRRASEAAPDSVQAFFNLNQAYSRMFEFGLSNDALERANRLDRAQVNRWQAQEDSGQHGVGIDGGLAHADQIREKLRSAWQIGDRSVTLFDLWRSHLSLSIATAALILAVMLFVMRRQLGLVGADSPTQGRFNRWLGIVIPGFRSVQLGHGVRAFLTILIFVGLLLSALQGLGYRPPLGHDPASWLLPAVSLVALIVWLTVRALRASMTGAGNR